MFESSIVVRPEPKGSAGYAASSRLQAAGLPEAIARFTEAAATVPVPAAPQPIVIADYGAATGHNALLPVGAAISTLRQRTRSDHSILVVHTDVPDNDFTALFRTLAEDPDSYLAEDSGTFASAVGRSFYEQILPSSSVMLGWSSWAIQWLSKVPAPVPDHIAVAYCRGDAVRAAHARVAARDWHEFIAFRGRELRKDGRLVVITMGVGDDGEFGYRSLLAGLLDALEELRASGLISDDELHRMCIPVVGRSAADFASPFAPRGRFEQLEIEHIDVFNAPDRFWAQYRVDGDARAFGARWAAFLRAAVFNALAIGLDGGRTDPRVPQFFDRLETGVAQRMAADPEEQQIPMAVVVLTKRHRPV